ncbi:septal ring lytic transglycosylase RlpA family protein [Parelusimicrobium proximum]|uniref:septal ring lytic transglycosylase RlpA family protein n=1 Tax=Parelusimicrobium proximum TaxID=3228953 RepID=UPI003D17AD8A
MRKTFLILAATLFLASCASTGGGGGSFSGKASWYGTIYNGRKTASGEIYSEKKMTAAHRTLPFGTIVKVTNKANGKSVKVKINDRGPFIKGRVIDLSKAAFAKIANTREGVVEVKVKVVSRPK